MLPKALNQMTVPDMPVGAVLHLARSLGCTGVELRNDLGRPLFDGLPPATVKTMAADVGQRILAVAEVKAFNVATANKIHTTRDLIAAASAAGAEAVALIPHMGTAAMDRAAQRAALHTALIKIQPLLEDQAITGLIEPLGFVNSSLRHKDDVADVLNDLGRPACFKIVHDTFHHNLSGDTGYHADMTGLVHISGITDPAPQTTAMTDAQRVLVDAQDRLGNITQLQALESAGYTGPISFECFAPAVHDIADPKAALAGSFAYIASHLTAAAT